MLGAKTLGNKLSTRLTERARHYFGEAAKSDGQTKNNQNVVGVALAELATIIRDVTGVEGESE